MEKLTSEEKWDLENALEEHMNTLRTRFQGPNYGTKYTHPADKYDKLLKKLRKAEYAYIQ